MAIQYTDLVQTVPSTPTGGLGAVDQYVPVTVLAKALGKAGPQSFVGGQIDTLNRLRDSFARAKVNNPETNALLSPSPTLLSTSSGDGTLTKIYTFDNATSFLDATGGRLYHSSANHRASIANQNVAGDTGNFSYLTAPVVPAVPAGENIIGPYYFKFMTDAIKIQIVGAAVAASLPLRFIVDGSYIDLTGNDFSSNIYYQITFATKKPRLIEIECQWQFSLFQLCVDPLSRIWKPKPIDPVRAAITGDSHTEGFSGIPTTAWSGCSPMMARLLGIWDMWITSVGGTGYLKTGTSTLRKTIFNQMTDWVTTGTYDMILFAGGYNDLGLSVTSTTAQALACWQKARAAQPNALIIVFGIWGSARGPDVTLTTLETAIKNQFIAWADPFSAFIPVSTAFEPWEFGTGFSGATNGTGNSDNYVSADGIHALAAGQQYRGYRMADTIRQVVYAMTQGATTVIST